MKLQVKIGYNPSIFCHARIVEFALFSYISLGFGPGVKFYESQTPLLPFFVLDIEPAQVSRRVEKFQILIEPSPLALFVRALSNVQDAEQVRGVDALVFAAFENE